MANKSNNRQKQTQRKVQKKKQRQERIRKQTAQLKEGANAARRLTIDTKVDIALDWAAAGDMEAAANLLEQLKASHSDHPSVNYGLGVLAVHAKDYDKSMVYFRRTIKADPNFMEAHYNLAESYLKKLNIAQAILSFRQVLAIDLMSTDVDANEVVSMARDNLRDLEKLVRKHEHISLDEYISGHEQFELGVSSMGARDWLSAIEHFTNCLAFSPRTVQAYGNLGACYGPLGKIQLALEALDRAIELDPNYEVALVNRHIISKLSEGEVVQLESKMVEYYKDYPAQNKSYIQEIIEGAAE